MLPRRRRFGSAPGLVARAAWLLAIATVGLPALAGADAAPTAGAEQDQIEAWCKQLSPRLPGVSVADCRGSALMPTGAHSSNGFPILMHTLPAAKAGGNDRPLHVLLLGGIHGDELTAAAIVFEWMQWLHGPQAHRLDWHVVPVLNPDGLLALKPQRMNANGVDLNRNFPTPGWKQAAEHYWVKTTHKDPRRFPGNAPLSEPETRWLHQEMERFQPDVIISVHAPFGVLDFDGPTKAPRRFGRLYLNQVGVYPGSLGNYGGVHKRVPVITIELPNALKMPPPAEVRRIWVDMISWIVHNVPDQDDRLGFQRVSTSSAVTEH